MLLILAAPLAAAAQSDDAARQVLLLQAMDTVPYDRFTASLRTALQSRSGARVTVFDFVLDPVGLAEPPETPIIEFLQSLYTERPPDLIVTVGGPAVGFIRKHRDDLFPHTPVLFAAVEERILRAPPLGEHETAVAVSIDYTRTLEDMLELLPETRNVFMVTGSGPLSAFWYTEFRRNFARYGNRLTFSWSQDLSYEQMLQRAATLPPHSAIYYMTSSTFAARGWQGDQRTLAELSARASAPVFGAQSVWLGAGIIGGHLFDIEGLGVDTADIVMRMLSGEPPASLTIPLRSLGLVAFDARQLRRWDIPEARLPAGSDIWFRDPSVWRDYRRGVLAVIGALLLQSLLIVGLLHQRRSRRKAEVDGRRHQAEANRLATVSALTSSMARELSQPLNAILHNAQAAEMLFVSNRATPEVLREILTDIHAADLRAAEIIQRHRLMLRCHQAGHQPIDVRVVVQESLRLMSPDTNRQHVSLDVDLPADPCIVLGDQVLLQQVVINLITNAIEAMADTPTDRRRIAVRCDALEGHAVISVCDAGTGLVAEVAADGQLFEPFVTTKTAGRGIGLTIARSIVEAHLGHLDARNSPDGGAIFTLTLPLEGRVEPTNRADPP